MNEIQLKENRAGKKVVKGILTSFIITLIGIVILAIILTYTNVSENIIPITLAILVCGSVLVSTIINLKNLTKKGLLNGGIIGIAYIILLYIISGLLNSNFQVNMYTAILIMTSILSGMIGGIISVNTK